MNVRAHAGALVYDWPRFLRSMLAGRGGWTRFRNRNERLTIDPATGGVRCEWQFSSDLHLCNISPLAARMLMRRALKDWPIASAQQPSVSGKPRVSFVIGHRGESRVPQLLATIATIAAQRHVPIECIVVEQSARAILPAHLPSWVRYIHTPIESDDLPYNRSHAFNVGAEAARAPLLVLHDNDLLVPVDYAREIAARHDEGWEMIEVKRLIFYLGKAATATPERVSQNFLGGGSVVADRKAYFDIGGFDESYAGWGGEDNDFWERAATRRCWTFGYLPLIHLWHPPQREKTEGGLTEGQKRYYERAKIPPEERIAALRDQKRSK
jgi:hypothetical protein